MRPRKMIWAEMLEGFYGENTRSDADKEEFFRSLFWNPRIRNLLEKYAIEVEFHFVTSLLHFSRVSQNENEPVELWLYCSRKSIPNLGEHHADQLTAMFENLSVEHEAAHHPDTVDLILKAIGIEMLAFLEDGEHMSF